MVIVAVPPAGIRQPGGLAEHVTFGALMAHVTPPATEAASGVAVMLAASRPCVVSVMTTSSARPLVALVITTLYVSLPSCGTATIEPPGSAVEAADTVRLSVPVAPPVVTEVDAEALLFEQLISTAFVQVGSTVAESVIVPVFDGAVAVILIVALALAASCVVVVQTTGFDVPHV